jgi:hypothetical protein
MRVSVWAQVRVLRPNLDTSHDAPIFLYRKARPVGPIGRMLDLAGSASLCSV